MKNRVKEQTGRAWGGVWVEVVVLALLSLGFVVVEAGEPESGEERLALIQTRNIFDPNRSAGRRAEAGGERAAAPSVERVVLIGTMLHEGRAFSFFDGSSAAYRQVLSPGEEIAGFKIVGITTAGVDLERGDVRTLLTVGAGLRREGEGEWTGSDEPMGRSPAAVSGSGERRSTTEGAPPIAEATEEANEVMRRMMERRRQEDAR